MPLEGKVLDCYQTETERLLESLVVLDDEQLVELDYHTCFGAKMGNFPDGVAGQRLEIIRAEIRRRTGKAGPYWW